MSWHPKLNFSPSITIIRIDSYLKFFIISYISTCGVCVPWCTFRSQRTACRSWLPFSPVGVLETEYRSLGSAGISCIRWVTLPALNGFYKPPSQWHLIIVAQGAKLCKMGHVTRHTLKHLLDVRCSSNTDTSMQNWPFLGLQESSEDRNKSHILNTESDSWTQTNMLCVREMNAFLLYKLDWTCWGLDSI